MINIKNKILAEPYLKFYDSYESAVEANQSAVEAIAISSFNKNKNEVESRFVNLKYIDYDKWTFFSNYKSNKADNFCSHNQISALFYWSSINTQVRIKAHIIKSEASLSDMHFKKRSLEKNALAISSEQSKTISSFVEVEKKYNEVLNKISPNSKRPDYWGGYSFKPYYFEFWKGHEYRLNKRVSFELVKKTWIKKILQP
tara:strand:+ start:31952 stop:32551 length:600 start_codon:yes stop_codon:yes gene_type:complete